VTTLNLPLNTSKNLPKQLILKNTDNGTSDRKNRTVFFIANPALKGTPP